MGVDLQCAFTGGIEAIFAVTARQLQNAKARPVGLFGMAAVALLPPASDQGGFLTGLGFQSAEWILPVLIPGFAALVAFVATGLAARRVMGDLT